MARTPALLLALAACGPGAPPAADETSDTSVAPSSDTTSDDITSNETPTTGEVDSETDAACLEVERQDDGDPTPEWQLGCDTPQLCPGDESLLVILHGSDIRSPESVEIAELERARCMVEALAQRHVGQFDLTVVWSTVVTDVYSLELLGDQAIVRSAFQNCTLQSQCKIRESLRVLRPPAFFADCVDGDADALWLCLSDALEPEPACLPGPLECPRFAPQD